MGDEDIRQLVAKIDESPDALHLDVTPAVTELGKKGLRIIPHLRPALESPSEMTRLHAQRALENAVLTHFGFVGGRGFTQPGGEQKARELLARNGSYDYQAPADARRKAIEAWMSWYDSQPKP
jgi:hypothetical protein